MGEINRENYHVKALEFAKKSGWCPTEKQLKQGEGQAAPTIKKDTLGFDRWGRYFRSHLGWVPVAYRMLEEGGIKEMTVPAEMPEWFDSSYVPVNHERAIPARTRPAVHRPSMAELQDRYGESWGIKKVEDAIKPQPLRAPSDDELRAHYGVQRKEAAE